MSGSVQAVIVGGTLGTGNNNNDPAVLQSWLTSNSYPSFGYWDNLVSVGDGSGVYLGYNESTQTGWVLSAAHINPQPGTITVGGSNYTVAQTHTVGVTDLILYEIGGLGDPALPTLPTVPLASTAASSGEFSLMMGRGFTPSSSAPYSWGSPGDMRWGTNIVEGVGTLSGVYYIVTNFDAVSPTAYEAQGAVGDSGGGIFVYRGGQWILSGIAYSVADQDDDSVNPSEFGDLTLYTDIFTYRTMINSLTGTLVPEPSATTVLTSGLLGMLIRRRRSV